MNRDKVLSGLFWTFAERFGAQIVSFIVSIILARLLLPEDYGIIAMVAVLINVANAFVTGGFGNSLIQKKDADDLDFSTVFYFNFVFSLFIYGVVFFVAPYLEAFYEQPGLALVTRVLALRLLVSGVNSIQRAYISRRMQFKKFFMATFFGTIFSAVVGISLAYAGYGVWALVAQDLTNTFMDTIILWVIVKWRPKKMFSIERLIGLFSYGWKLLCSSLLSAVYVELNELVIGKMYSASDLAYYSKGKRFPALFVTNINSAVETVLFPLMSQNQDKKDELKKKTQKSIQLSTYFVFPLVFGLAGVSKNLITILLTEKWIESATYMSIACISYALIPIGMANLQAIKAVGRSDLYLAIDTIKKFVGISFLVVSLKYGVVAIAIAEVASNVVGFGFNLWPNRKILNYGIKEQIKDVIPALSISVVMYMVVVWVGGIEINKLLLLIMQVIIGIFVYLLLSIIIKPQAYKDCLMILKKFRGK